MQQTVGGEADQLHSLFLAVSQFAQSFDPKVLSGSDAKRILHDAARAKSILAVVESLALVRIEETEAHKAAGYRSAADYGAAKTGAKRGEAQRAMRTAKRARRLPQTDEAMRRGELSPRQADAIADAATVNPEAEDDLLAAAKTDDVGTLERKAKRAKSSADHDAQARTRRIHARRSLRHWTDEEGAFHTHLRTTVEAGARLLEALKPYERAAFEAARREGRREAPDAYAADALDLLIGDHTSPSDDAAPRPNPTTTPDVPSAHVGPDERPGPTVDDRAPDGPRADRADGSEDPDRPNDPDRPDDPDLRGARTTRGQDPPARSAVAPNRVRKPQPRATSAPRATVFLNIDLAPLLRGHLIPGETCEIPGVGPIDLASAQTLLGDATIELILKKGTDICSVVHYGRTVTAAQRRALEARDPVCIVPGCGQTKGLQIDHRRGWAITHTTSLDDLARLCAYHHMLKTLHGCTYTGGPGTWRWHPPGTDPPGQAPDGTDQPDLFSKPP